MGAARRRWGGGIRWYVRTKEVPGRFTYSQQFRKLMAVIHRLARCFHISS